MTSLILADVSKAQALLAPHIIRTPTSEVKAGFLKEMLPDSDVFLKYELFQVSGTFKARGVLNNLLSITDRSQGVTAASAGNHAIAVSVASKLLGLDAKVVMQSSANPARIAAAKAAGAEIIIAKDGPEAFAMAHELEAKEGRLFVHPFDGIKVAEATAGIAQEFMDDASGLDAIIVAIGGGGLAGGLSAGVKLLNPECMVFGVEPVGAAAMAQSFKQGSAATLLKLNTIADSLAPPMTTDITYALCRDNVDELLTVTDDQMAAGSYLLFRDMKLSVEPGGAAATAAAVSKLVDRLGGKRVGIILCGSNIDEDSFCKLIKRGRTQFEKGVLGNST